MTRIIPTSKDDGCNWRLKFYKTFARGPILSQADLDQNRRVSPIDVRGGARHEHVLKFIVLFGVVVALAAILWWYYPTFRGLPDASHRETKCKAVRESADIQEGLSMLHEIDESLAKLDIEYAEIKKN